MEWRRRFLLIFLFTTDFTFSEVAPDRKSAAKVVWSIRGKWIVDHLSTSPEVFGMRAPDQ